MNDTLAPPLFPAHPVKIKVYGEDGHQKIFLVTYKDGKFDMVEQRQYDWALKPGLLIFLLFGSIIGWYLIYKLIRLVL